MPRPLAIFSVSGLLASAVGLFAGAAAAPPPPPDSADIRDLSREALAVLQEGKYPEYLRKMQALVALRPDYPRLHVNLAAAYVVNNRPEDAVAALEPLVALGLHSPVDKSAEFASMLERPDFKSVVARLNANLRPVGSGEVAFSLPAQTGIIEGMAHRASTGEFFFGDVHHRAVWVRHPRTGALTRFTTDDPVLNGVFGLLLDERNQTLWAATTARPEMKGFTRNQANAAGVAEIDLATGRVRRVTPIALDQEDHVVGDLALGDDGAVYATDSAAPVLWRFGANGIAGIPFVESPKFASLQGIVALPGRATLIVSDYVNGLFAVDTRSRTFWPVTSPPGTTLVGIDGLALAPDGRLIAVQNGVRPVRVLALTLNGTTTAVASASVLESGHITMGDPALGTIAGEDFVFIGNSGWTRFEPPATTAANPRPVPVFRTKLK